MADAGSGTVRQVHPFVVALGVHGAQQHSRLGNPKAPAENDGCAPHGAFYRSQPPPMRDPTTRHLKTLIVRYAAWDSFARRLRSVNVSRRGRRACPVPDSAERFTHRAYSVRIGFVQIAVLVQVLR